MRKRGDAYLRNVFLLGVSMLILMGFIYFVSASDNWSLELEDNDSSSVGEDNNLSMLEEINNASILSESNDSSRVEEANNSSILSESNDSSTVEEDSQSGEIYFEAKFSPTFGVSALEVGWSLGLTDIHFEDNYSSTLDEGSFSVHWTRSTTNDIDIWRFRYYEYDVLQNTEFSTDSNKSSWDVDVDEDGNYSFDLSAIDADSENISEVVDLGWIYVDADYPNITYDATTVENNSYLDSGVIYVKVNVVDDDELETTFNLYNSSGLADSVTYTDETHSHFFSSLDSDTYSFVVVYEDDAGYEVTTETRTVVVDLDDPVVSYANGTEDDEAVINQSHIYINVSVIEDNEANITFNLYNSSGLVNSVTYTNDTREVMFSELPLGNTYYYNVTVTDLAGRSNLAETREIVLAADETDPVVEFVNTITLANNTYTYQDAIYFKVDVEEDNEESLTFSIYNSSGLVDSVVYAGGTRVGHFNVPRDDTYYYNVTVVDVAGNSGSTETRVIVIDRVTPEIDFTTGTEDDDAVVGQDFVFVNVSVVEDIGFDTIFYLYKDYGSDLYVYNETTFSDGTTEINFTGLTDGYYKYKVGVRDDANNYVSSETRVIYLDNVGPIVDFGAGTADNDTSYTVTYPFADHSNTWVYINTSITEANIQNVTFYLYDENLNLEDSYTYESVGQVITSDDELDANFTELDGGVYYYNVTVCDVVGDCDSTETRMIDTDDYIDPVVEFNYMTADNNSYENSDNVFIKIDTDEANIKFYHYYLSNASMIIDSYGISNPYTFINLNDGEYSYYATVEDDNGNIDSSESRVITLDSVDPAVDFSTGTEANGSTVTDDWIYVNVSVTEINEANITFNLYDSSGLVNSTTYTDGITEINFTGLSNQNYYYNVTVFDLAGNSNSTETRTITINATDPTDPIVVFSDDTPANNSYISQDSFDFGVNVTDANLDNVTAYLYHLGGSMIGAVTIDSGSDMSWSSSEFIGSLPDEEYLYYVVAYDESGNFGSTEDRIITVDTTDPSIEFSSGTEANDSIVTNHWIYINISVTEENEANVTFNLYDDDGNVNTTTLDAGNYDINFSGLSNDDYYYNVIVMDLVGRSSSTGNRTITIDVDDTTDPVVTYVGETEDDDSYVSRDWIYFEVDVVDDNEANITFDLGRHSDMGVTYAKETFTNETREYNITGLSEGYYEYDVMVYDTEGNSGDAGTRYITLDTTNPTLEFDDNTEDDYAVVDQDYVYMELDGHDLNPANITYTLTGTGYSNSTTLDIGETDGSMNFTGLNDGEYYYWATFTDLAGNTNTTETRTIMLNATDPVVGFRSPTEDNGSYEDQDWIYVYVNVVEASEDNITFELYNSSGLVNSTVFTDESRAINFTGLMDGEYEYNVTVVDSSSDSGSSDTRTIILDTTEPVVDFDPGIEDDDSVVAQDWIYVNVSVVEENPKEVHFILLDSSLDLVDNEVYSEENYSHNFTGLSDGEYYYDVYVEDMAGNGESSDLRKITLDNDAPLISYTGVTEENGSYVSRNYIEVEVEVEEENEANITFELYNSFGLTAHSTYTDETRLHNFTGIEDGEYYYNVTIVDGAGASSSVGTRTITVDTTNPLISFNDALSEDNGTVSYVDYIYGYVNVTEVNEANITFSLYNLSGLVDSETFIDATRDDHFSDLKDGDYWYNVTIVDLAGNSNSTETRVITIDATEPAINFSSGTEENGSYVTQDWVYIEVDVTEDNEESITFYLYNSSGLVDFSTYTDATRVYNFTSIDDGEYWYNVTVVDSTSREEDTETRTITLDTTDPVVTFSTGTEGDDEYVARDYIYINAAVVEINEANITFYLYDSSGLVNSTTYTDASRSVNYTDLSGGEYYYYIEVMDYAGNLDETLINRTITLDATEPVVDFSIGTEENGSYVARDYVYVDVEVTEENEANVTYELYNSSGLVNSSTYTDATRVHNFIGLVDGEYEYNVTVVDEAGSLASTETRVITLDMTNPVVTFSTGTEGDDGYVAHDWIYINAAVTEINEANITFYLYDSSGLVNSTTYTDASRSVNYTDLSNGEYYYYIEVMDYAGNLDETLVNRTITLDTTEPVVEYTNATEDDGADLQRHWVYIEVEVTEDNEENITFNLYDALGLEDSATYTNGTRFVNFTGLEYEEYWYNVSVVDVVGHEASTETRMITLHNISYDGAGNSTDPFTIWNCTDLQDMQDDLTAYYELRAEIDCSGMEFEPVGNSTDSFSGHFDGRDYVVSDLYINSSEDNVGLFGYVDGSNITRVGLVDVNISGGSYIGGLVGYATSAMINETYVAGLVSGDDYVGGLAGDIQSSVNVYDSYSSAIVSGVDYVGGLFGGLSGTVYNLYATGAVDGDSNIGGLVGISDGGEIGSSYATGDVDANHNAGGLVGKHQRGGIINNSYATGEVVGANYKIGGLVGWNHESNVTNSYATGNVTSGSWGVGGLIGTSAANSTISYSFATGVVSVGTVYVGGVIGSDDGSSNIYTELYWYNNSADDAVACIGTLSDSCDNNSQDDISYFFDNSNVPLDSWDFAVWDSVCDTYGYPSLAWEGVSDIRLCGAFSDVWTLDGNGSVSEPFEITTCEDLQNMSVHLDVYYELANDIDCLDSEDWNSGVGFVPVGDDSNYFTGELDGRDYVVSDLYINSSEDNVGLFGYVDGSNITRIGLVDVNVSGGDSVGGLIGYADGTCVINGTYTSGSVLATGDGAGGLIGVAESDVEVIDSYSDANVSGVAYIGGLMGVSEGGISNSYATGDVVGSDWDVGGLVGDLEYGSVNNSYATGDVVGTDWSVGGLVGTIYYGEIYNSYATGDVMGVGDVGGLVGSSAEADIVNSFSVGSVEGTSGVGGLIGDGYEDVIVNSYWLNDSTDDADYCVGNNVSIYCNAQTDITYFFDLGNEPIASLDDNIWDDFCEYNGYPSLDWEGLSDVTSCLGWVAPYFTTIADQSIDYNEDLEYTVVAYDRDGIVNYSVDDTTNFATTDAGVLTNAATLSASTIYTLNITATDAYDNSVSDTMTVTVGAESSDTSDGGSTSSGGGGGGGGTTATTEEVTEEVVGNITEQTGEVVFEGGMVEGDVVYFEVEGEQHNATLHTISESSVFMIVHSDPQNITISVGEMEMVDTNDDGFEEVQIYLGSIVGGVANIVLTVLIQGEEEGLPEQLFDIRMDLEETIIENANELEVVITFASFGTVPTPVDLTYVILDEAGNEVYREGGEIVVTTEEVLRKRFAELELENGRYIFVFSSLYNVDVYDEYTSEFTVGRRATITGNVVGWAGGTGKWWLIGLVIVFVGVAWWLIRRKNKKMVSGR